MKHILLATDGSTSADRAADVAAGLANAFEATLTILTVVGPMKKAAHGLEPADQFGGVQDALAEESLDRARARAEALGTRQVSVQRGWGDPAEVIIERAREIRADAIVLGRRGRGQLAGLLLGSVSQKLVSLAATVVVVVP